MHLREIIQVLELDLAYRTPVNDVSGVDLQGWDSKHPVISQAIRDIRPTQIVEVGTWKGASAIFMADCARKHAKNITVLCIDTFTGANSAFWRQGDIREIRDEYGFPTTYRQFIYNVVATGLSNQVYALPTTSTCGADILSHFGAKVDLVYIDGGHREEEVALDLADFWRVLRPGGVLIGDDYSPGWPGVVRAVNKFAALQAVPLQTDDRKWRLDKPVSPALTEAG